ncbi:WD40-repeat-containing domain protein [Ilyonectria sp. MPI-CAGE-AT-0026]|nr:WD40-repeat-containing domain protein [Ilyonectria sp. MPI-CAGE-AT-0026]
MVASASRDMTVRIWNAKTGNCEQVLEGHSYGVNSVVFSHDLTMVASASHDKTVRIWDPKTGVCKEVISLDFYVDALSFTFDGRGLATSTGVISLTSHLMSSTEPVIPSQPSTVSGLGLRDETWVTTAGTDLLWLPPECRGGGAAVSGSMVAVGCPSGRVILLGFSDAEIAKMLS